MPPFILKTGSWVLSIFTTQDELRTIFGAALIKEEGRAPSYH